MNELNVHLFWSSRSGWEKEFAYDPVSYLRVPFLYDFAF